MTKQLDKRHAKILQLRDKKKFTYAKIGEMFGVTGSRIIQLYGEAKKLSVVAPTPAATPPTPKPAPRTRKPAKAQTTPKASPVEARLIERMQEQIARKNRAFARVKKATSLKDAREFADAGLNA